MADNDLPLLVVGHKYGEKLLLVFGDSVPASRADGVAALAVLRVFGPPVLDRACGRGSELGVIGRLFPCGGNANAGGVKIFPTTLLGAAAAAGSAELSTLLGVPNGLL